MLAGRPAPTRRRSISSLTRTYAFSPGWSPDGKRIVTSVFVQSRASRSLHANSDGTRPAQLTNTPDAEDSPTGLATPADKASLAAHEQCLRCLKVGGNLGSAHETRQGFESCVWERSEEFGRAVVSFLSRQG